MLYPTLDDGYDLGVGFGYPTTTSSGAEGLFGNTYGTRASGGSASYPAFGSGSGASNVGTNLLGTSSRSGTAQNVFGATGLLVHQVPISSAVR